MPADPRKASDARRGIFYSPEGQGGTWQHVDHEAAGAYITAMADELRYLPLEIARCVGAALAGGATWADVGGWLGISRQAAAQKYPGARQAFELLDQDEQERLNKLVGSRAMRIVFEVRSAAGEVVSRHYKLSAAQAAAAKRAEVVSVVKVYPNGQEVVTRSYVDEYRRRTERAKATYGKGYGAGRGVAGAVGDG